MTKRPENEVETLQSLWPSYADFARDLNLKDQAAQQMRRRNKIHPDYFPAIVKAARDRNIKGVDLKGLYKIRGIDASGALT